MKHFFTIVIVIITLTILPFSCKNNTSQLPNGFAYLEFDTPTLKKELRYFSSNNFVGDTINGYKKDTLIGTKALSQHLNKIQKLLAKEGLGLLIYDAYRPQSAVTSFEEWAKRLNDTVMKQKFYPDVKKERLFELDYIASKSSHTRGSTVDVTLVYLSTGKPLDMGTPYDFFGEESWVSYNQLTPKQLLNRNRLQKIMLENGFSNYPKEWWHFTLKNEPFPDTYFDFSIQ